MRPRYEGFYCQFLGVTTSYTPFTSKIINAMLLFLEMGFHVIFFSATSQYFIHQ